MVADILVRELESVPQTPALRAGFCGVLRGMLAHSEDFQQHRCTDFALWSACSFSARMMHAWLVSN